MNGWLKLWRALPEHPVWHLSPGQFKVGIACLALANFKPGECRKGGHDPLLELQLYKPNATK